MELTRFSNSVIPLSIVGAHRFYGTLIDFLGVIGYWASAFVGILLVEHLVFRNGVLKPVASPDTTSTREGEKYGDEDRGMEVWKAYNPDAWDKPHLLPSGLAALAAGACSVGLVVPGMHQVR